MQLSFISFPLLCSSLQLPYLKYLRLFAIFIENNDKILVELVPNCIRYTSMIESEFIKDILDLTFEGEKHSDLLFQQIDHLKLKETDYTGVGCYYYFEQSKEIENFKLSKNQLLDLFGNSCHMIQNVYIINQKVNVNAQAMVWLIDGLIDCIEIWNGSDTYPKGELITYKLIKG